MAGRFVGGDMGDSTVIVLVFSDSRIGIRPTFCEPEALVFQVLDDVDIAGFVGLPMPCAGAGGVDGAGSTADRCIRGRRRRALGHRVLCRSRFRSTKEQVQWASGKSGDVYPLRSLVHIEASQLLR